MPISYSQFAEVTPSVLSSAGSNVDLTGLVLTQSSLATVNTPISYASSDAVGDVFGLDSDEYNYASIYFSAPDNATTRPASILIAGYSSSDGTISECLDAVKAVNSNFGSIGHVFEAELADMLLISKWVNGQDDRYAYAGWYTNVDASGSSDTSSFAYEVIQADYDGTIPIFGDMTHGAAVQSYISSIDWSAANGRTTLAFRQWSGLLPYIDDDTAATNLLTNGYNFYGQYGANGNSDNLMRNGTMPGQWKWVDSYINQIYLNAQLQYAIVSLFKGSKSIPYNSAGKTLIRAALKSPIDSALSFGSIRTGITLSTSQAADIQAVVGSDVSGAIYSDGYYLYIPDATATERAARTSPTIYFWYADGGSVQSITIASIEVQ